MERILPQDKKDVINMIDNLQHKLQTLSEEDIHVAYRILEKWLYNQNEEIDGGTKAAIVLQALPQSAAKDIISWFELYENGILNEKLDRIADIDEPIREQIVQAFLTDLESFKRTTEYRSQLFLEELEIESSRGVLDKPIEVCIVELIPFVLLNRISNMVHLQHALFDEKPETIAYVVYHLEAQKREKLLALFSHELKEEIRRALISSTIHKDIAFEIERRIIKKMQESNR